jgi:hypothetical protein
LAQGIRSNKNDLASIKEVNAAGGERFLFAAKKKIIYWKPGDTRRRLCLWLLVWFSYQGEKVVLNIVAGRLGVSGPLRF